MKKLLNNPYIVGALVLLALLVAFRKPMIDWMQRSKFNQIVSTMITNVNESLDIVKNQSPQQAQSEILPEAKIEVKDIQWILKPYRNPFKKRAKGGDEVVKTYEDSTAVASTNQTFKLTAIIIEQEKKFVMINGKILSEGEYVSGYRVYSIDRDFVILKGFGDERRLTFNEMQQESGQKQ